jgi:peptide/nickel transport system substrate-binding protein
MWGFWSTKSKFHDPKLTDYYKRDLPKAKRLLADAGFANGLDIEFVVPSTGGLGLKATEIIQQQWKEIGVNLKIVQSANTTQDFFIENRYPGQFFQLQRDGLDRVTRNLVPGSIGNVCNWNHAGLNAVVDQLRAVKQDSPEAVELWHQLDKLALDEAMSIFGVFGTSANAYNEARLANVKFIPNFQGQPVLDFFNVYVKKK